MTTSIIKIIANNTIFQLTKEALFSESEEIQSKITQDKLVLPSWIESDVFSYFVKYINKKQLDQYKEKIDDTTFLIQTIRISDYLAMIKFQEKFITDILTPSINIRNCVVFLQETHRKLRIQQNGSQSWYGLLNASITFLAMNLNQIYSISADKIKKLHQKILNEILDRAIRNGNINQKMIFQLIIQSKKMNTVQLLCQNLRNSILNKKINPKIHAKLSWKLQDVLSIKDKKTKNFKFLDFDWLLEATRDNPTNDLIIKLTYCGGEKRCEIGAFYAKVMWWIQGKSDDKIQQQIRLNYILMTNRHQITILRLNEQKQRELSKNKIELSIFCCMDQIYTFILNYLANHHQTFNLVEQRKLTPEELYAIVVYLKEKQAFTASIRFLKILAGIQPQLPVQLISNYPYHQLPSYQIDFLQKHKNNSTSNIHSNSHSGLTSSIKTYTPALSELSDVRSNTSQSRKSEERPQSRGRLRKIFASSPSNKEVDMNTIRLQDINRISNIRNYFYDKSHPFYMQL